MTVKETKGTCSECGAQLTVRTAKKHLLACMKKRETAEQPSRLFLIKVEGYGYGNYHYWIYLLMPEEAKLRDLDKFLRKTWLECCGHLSQFRIGRGITIAMGKELGDVLQPSLEFLYDYDFGSTTTLKVSLAGIGGGTMKKGKVELVARNDAPSPKCDQCGEKATLICPQCMDDGVGWLCPSCSGKHDCGLGSFLPFVNSPRAGVCGYGYAG
jgi:hypothetical protein